MKKILIIEDEEILIDLLQKKLKAEGYDVSLARDGEEGINKIREIKPDLILLDILMPKKNGFEVMQEIKEDPELAKISVIAISNSGQPVEVDRLLEMGVKDYLIKTQFDPAEILKKVAEQLGEVKSFNSNNSKNKNNHKNNKTQKLMKPTLIKNNSNPGDPRKKILIIEDDKFLRELLVRKLESEGLKTVVAVDGSEGVKAVEEQKPDLILLDLLLPAMDGFEVLKRIKEDPRTASIPVIILSNLGQRDDVERGLGLGAVDFLIKAHFTPNEVIEKIKGYLPH